jgi:hypothetical protein
MKLNTCDFCGKVLVRENNYSILKNPMLWMSNYRIVLHKRSREIVSGYPPVRLERMKYDMCDRCWENMCKYIIDNVDQSKH